MIHAIGFTVCPTSGKRKFVVESRDVNQWGFDDVVEEVEAAAGQV